MVKMGSNGYKNTSVPWCVCACFRARGRAAGRRNNSVRLYVKMSKKKRSLEVCPRISTHYPLHSKPRNDRIFVHYWYATVERHDLTKINWNVARYTSDDDNDDNDSDGDVGLSVGGREARLQGGHDNNIR